jgi:DNA-binding GntR family transcriptional regulator
MQYVKIKQAIAEQIEQGELSAGQKLPSERKLAGAFDTTRVTLREALSLLEAEGHIYREDRRGWFIAPVALRYDLSHSIDVESAAVRQNRTYSCQLISAKNILANKMAIQRLTLKPFSDVYEVKRCMSLAQRPVAFIIHYINVALLPNLLKQDLTQSLTELYQDQYPLKITTVRYRVTSGSLMGNMAVQLRATSGTPATIVERTLYAGETVIAADTEYWRHDAIDIESIIVL